MRIVLDTNTLVRAAGNESGLAGRLLSKIATGPHVLLCSPYILSEVVRVLAYPRLRARWFLGQDQIAKFETGLAAVAEIVPTNAPFVRVVPADLEDDPIVETAVAGRADVLCTLDAHLLEPVVLQYCRDRGVQIMDDVHLIRLLGAAPEL